MISKLLAGLGEEQRRAVLQRARRRRFSRREIIFHEGDRGDAVHLVDRGHVAVQATTPMGDTALLRVIEPGEFFGELVLLSPGARSATALAIEGAETLSLLREDFNEIRSAHPSVQAALDAALADEIRRLASALSDALYRPAEARLWRALLRLGDSFERDGQRVIPLTQAELGQLVGIARPTANRLLAEAEAAGAVAVARGRVSVLDTGWLTKHVD